MNIFFLMHLAKIPILCFLWQTTAKSDSGNMCYYPFIQPFPCISHSFFSFLSISLLTDLFSWMLSLHTWCLCDKRWRVETVQFFSSRELNKLFPELWRLMNTELWFYCGKKINSISIIHSLIRKMIFALHANWRGKFSSHRSQPICH